MSKREVKEIAKFQLNRNSPFLFFLNNFSKRHYVNIKFLFFLVLETLSQIFLNVLNVGINSNIFKKFSKINVTSKNIIILLKSNQTYYR